MRKGTSDAICLHQFLRCLFNLIDEHRENEKNKYFTFLLKKPAIFFSAIFGYAAVGASMKIWPDWEEDREGRAESLYT